MKLKVCGMKYSDNIEEVSTLKPDYLGFIFYENSPRNFNGPKFSLKDISAVGVFVNAEQKTILGRINKYRLKAVQLHGEESPEYCVKLKKHIQQHSDDQKISLIKVFSVGESFDFGQLDAYEGKVDYFLFDTKSELKGGSGQTFNWRLLLKYNSNTPFFLSGGIGPEAVNEINLLVDELKTEGKAHLLHGLDVNSRFELEPGRKDKYKLMEFQEKLGSLLTNNEHEL